MSNHDDENDVELVPEDLQPGEDNPLAEPLDEDAPSPEELDMQGGKVPEELDEDQDEGEGEDGEPDE